VTPRSFAFRPRYRGIAWSSMGIGGAVAVVSAVLGFVTVPLVAGALGIALGATYLASPTWRIAVTVDDAGFTVGSPRRLRFRMAWTDVVRVVASPTTHSCFVDGGTPEHSLLVPGDGAPAPYDIVDRAALIDAILSHVPGDKVQTVASLDKVQPGAPPDKA
jgi:hypothetical protein